MTKDQGLQADHDRMMLLKAKEVATMSADPSTKVGAVLQEAGPVSPLTDYHIGFNGFPSRIAEDERLHDREKKYGLVVHAEERAIMACGLKSIGGTIYVTHLPCAHCMLLVVDAGIRRVVLPMPTDDYEERWADSTAKSKAIADEAGLILEYKA